MTILEKPGCAVRVCSMELVIRKCTVRNKEKLSENFKAAGFYHENRRP